VYWLGGETGLEALLERTESDGETTGAETERLELITGGTPLEELLPPYGGLTADDEPGFLLEVPSEELVIMGVESAGDDPGLPVIDIDRPDVVLDPYTGGWDDVVNAETDGLGAV